MKTTKNNSERVVKPVKGGFLNLIRKTKEEVTGEDGKKKTVEVTKELEVLTVVDQDDDVVATFSKQDHGPRFWFKATQYVSNNSTLDQRLHVRELA